MTRTIFVTGGAGYVGAHCCQAFANAGWSVVVFDNLSRGWRDFVRWGPLIVGDLRDGKAVADALLAVKPDAVAHFAALAYVGESVVDPAIYYTNNVTGTLNLLEAMRTASVAKLVFSSSCATYGVPEQTLIDEAHVQNPINPYGRSKLMVEHMLADYSTAYGLRYAALRYFNAAGADASGEIGERHQPETHAIPLAICAAMTGDGSFRIFGGDFQTADGTAVRDYVHVTDLADAHLKALEYLDGGGASDAFNLGAGRGVSVSEVVAAVERRSKTRLSHTVVDRRPGDPPALVADARKAQAVLGWSPVLSDIDSIIDSAWPWHERDALSRGETL
jgi:UDP-arabinose 4-epimerase